MNSTMKSAMNHSHNQINSSNPVFSVEITSKPCDNSISTLNPLKNVSTTSVVSKIHESKSKMAEKMVENSSDDDKMNEKAPKCSSRGNSPKNSTRKAEKHADKTPPPLMLISATFGTEDVKYHRNFKRISLGKIKWQRTANIPYNLDPRRIKQLTRELGEELMARTPMINEDNDDVIISKKILQEIKEYKFSPKNDKEVDRDTHSKSPEILFNNGDNITAVDASTNHSIGEDVVSSTDCGEQGERCNADEAEETIDSSSSTPSESSDDAPDSSLDFKAVKGTLELPELLDENRGDSCSHVIRRDIKFNSLKSRLIKESQRIADKEVSSDESFTKDNKELIMGVNTSVEKTKKPTQEENSTTVSSNCPQSIPIDNSILNYSISASPTSTYDKSSKKKENEMSEEFNKVKSTEKEERLSLSDKSKKRKESSDSNNVKGSEEKKSSRSSSKEESSEPDAKKKKKSALDEDSNDSIKKKDNLDHGKRHKDKESHSKHRSSSSSSTSSASKKRESSGSRSNSQEPHKKKHRTSESSSHSGLTPEKVFAKEKPKDSSLERNKKEKSLNSSAVNESKEDVKKQPTPIGSSKKRRVSRINSDQNPQSTENGTCAKERMKDKIITESRKSTNLINESVYNKKNTNESKLDGLQGRPQKAHTEEKPAIKFAEELRKEDVNQKNQENVKPIGQEETKQKASDKRSTGAGDYLSRKLAKIARDEIEKERKILSEVPKPASAVQRKKKAPPQMKTPAAPAADVLAINASVPIDDGLFENIDKVPLPPVPPVIPNKVFPLVLQDNIQIKTDQIPMICEASMPPLNDLVDHDLPDQGEYDETCSLDSVETVILNMSPLEPDVATPLSKEDLKDLENINELPSSTDNIYNLKSHEIEEYERLVRELELFEESIKNNAVEPKALNNNDNNDSNLDDNFNELATKDAKSIEIKPHNEIVVAAEAQRPETKHQIHPPIKSQSVIPFILMPFQMLLPDHSSELQKEEKEITLLYEEIIDLIQVTKYHRKKIETINLLEFEAQVKSVFKTFMKFFNILKKKENVITDEEMIQLIVEHSSHSPVAWHVQAEDVSWILRNSPIINVAPVPPPIAKTNVKLQITHNIMNNYHYAANQGHQPHHRLLSPKNEQFPTNPAAIPPGNVHLANTVPHSDQIVPNQRINPINNNSIKLPHPMPNFNHQSLDQRGGFPTSQDRMTMNANLQQQPPLPNQPFPQPPPLPPAPSQPLNSYQQVNYNNQYQQFMQNNRLLHQQMQHGPSYPPSYPHQFGLQYTSPQYFNQQQGPVQHIPQQTPPQNVPFPLNQASYPVPPNPMESMNLNGRILEDLSRCYTGRCQHQPNCERYSRFRQSLYELAAKKGELPPPLPVPSQLVGMQVQNNRDPRCRGGPVPHQQVPQPKVHQQSAMQKPPGNIMPRMSSNLAALQQMNQSIQSSQHMKQAVPSRQPMKQSIQSSQHMNQFIQPPHQMNQVNQLPQRMNQFIQSPQHMKQPMPSQQHMGQSIQPPQHMKQAMPSQQHVSQSIQPPQYMNQSIQSPQHMKQVMPSQLHVSQSIQPPQHMKQVILSPQYTNQSIRSPQHMNPSIQPPQHIQTQGILPELLQRLHPPRPQVSQSQFGSVGNQLINPCNKVPQNSIKQPPKVTTPIETRPGRSPVGQSREMIPTSTVPIPMPRAPTIRSPMTTNTYRPSQNGSPLDFSTGKTSTVPTPASRTPTIQPSMIPNTYRPFQNGSPLNFSTEKNLKPPEPLPLHSDIKDMNPKASINQEEVKQEKVIDIIAISSSEDEEELETKHPIKNPSFSQVDDEIECVGFARKLGIKLNEPSSSAPVLLEDTVNYPVIGDVMTIPMTDFERMNIIIEKEADQIDFKDEIPEEIPMEINKEESQLCICCKKKTAVYCCRDCDAQLFCSEICAKKSDHFASRSCIPIVKIDDD